MQDSPFDDTQLRDLILGRFLETYMVHLADTQRLFDDLETDDQRQPLSGLHPEFAAEFEQKTAEEKEDEAQVLATGAAVADAILFALRHEQASR